MEKKEFKINTVAVISWSVSHNPLGRAYMLAESLSLQYNVKLVGFLFEEHGLTIWEPIRYGDIPVVYYSGENYPGFTKKLESIASQIEADVILVCKPRMPSLQLGILMKELRNRLLILDIDDHELSFFDKEQKKYDEKDLSVPYGEMWTRYAETLIQYADHVIVSSTTLQEKYGGTIIPHARNEVIFNPELYSKDKRRKELGLSVEDKIVLFLGTPRKHKGLFQLLEAVKACGNRSYKLCIMGSFPDSKIKNTMQSIGGERLVLFPDQPFKDIAKNMVIADVVCLLQDTESEISKYQLPAKAIDAVAMGIPVLALETTPLKVLFEQGLVIPTTIETLSEDLDLVLTNTESFKKKQFDKRRVFLNEYSYGSIREKIIAVINNCNPKALPREALSFINLQTNLFNEVNTLFEPVIEWNNFLNEKLKNINNEIKVIEREKRMAEQKYNSILQSRTWRFTQPFRKVADFIKLVFRK